MVVRAFRLARRAAIVTGCLWFGATFFSALAPHTHRRCMSVEATTPPVPERCAAPDDPYIDYLREQIAARNELITHDMVDETYAREVVAELVALRVQRDRLLCTERTETVNPAEGGPLW